MAMALHPATPAGLESPRANGATQGNPSTMWMAPWGFQGRHRPTILGGHTDSPCGSRDRRFAEQVSSSPPDS
jgi:hypothetical protein